MGSGQLWLRFNYQGAHSDALPAVPDMGHSLNVGRLRSGLMQHDATWTSCMLHVGLL